jgi:hypothetical protein
MNRPYEGRPEAIFSREESGKKRGIGLAHFNNSLEITSFMIWFVPS